MNFFTKTWFLSESKDMFEAILNQNYKNSNNSPEFTTILGEVINSEFEKYKHEADLIIRSIDYSPIDLENWYEFDEENFHDYFDENCIIKNYKEALAYYSLNHLFLEHYEEHFDTILKNEYGV